MIDATTTDVFIAYCEIHRQWCMFMVLKRDDGIEVVQHYSTDVKHVEWGR